MIEPDREAERLVAALDNLLDGERAAASLVALGNRSIDPLRRFLVEGRPRTVYQPRRWAVQALGSLHARGVLAEYLSLPAASDAEVRFAEEAVQNAAVREFLRWRDEGTVSFLLELSKSRMIAGLCEVFGVLRVVEAAPYLDRALEDDICRAAAEEALIAIGEPVRDHLVLSAITKLPEAGFESPSSIRRRQSALRVLSAGGISPEQWPHLRVLIDDADPEIAVSACALAVKGGILADADPVIDRLLALCRTAPWFLHEAIVDALAAWFDRTQPAIERELRLRQNTPEVERIQDQSLRLLLRATRLGRSNTRHPDL